MRALVPRRFAIVVAISAVCAACSDIHTASEEDALAGSMRVPDIKVVSWISSIDLVECDLEIQADAQLHSDICCHGIPPLLCMPGDCAQLDLVCLALVNTANSDPPNSFSDTSWSDFQHGQEYRGFLHLNSFTVSCDGANRILGVSVRDPDYVDANTPTGNPNAVPAPRSVDPYGYTKIPNDHVPADIYLDPYDGLSWTISQPNPGTQCLDVRDQRSSRIAHDERAAQAALTQHDAPFIYNSLDVHFCCDTGRYEIAVARPIFPHSRLYIDNQRVDDIDQTGLTTFIDSGGDILANGGTPDGHGPFAPAGSSLHWNAGGWPPPPTDPCRGTTSNGLWCGRSTQGGFDPSHAIASDLYRCTGDVTTSTTDCGALGCFVAPPGVADSCCPADPCAHTTGNGLWCGQSTQAGFACGRTGWLYDCENHVTHSQTECPNGCTIAPSGQPDFCTGGCGAGCGPNFHCTGSGCVCNGPVCAGTCCPSGNFCGTNGRCCDGTCSPGCPC